MKGQAKKEDKGLKQASLGVLTIVNIELQNLFYTEAYGGKGNFSVIDRFGKRESWKETERK